MRLVILGLSLALTASAPLVAAAQSPVATQPLARGEVLLEINALGVVNTRADRATIPIIVSGTGETEEVARAEADRKISEVRTLLRAQGVADADISVRPAMAYEDAAMNAMNAAAFELNAIAADDVAMAPMATVNVPLEIVVRNVANFEAIQAALMQRGHYSLQSVTYTLNDDSGPRRQAREQALQKARVDAESYAAALNMRVVRVVRVSERLGFEMFGMMASEGAAMTNLFSPAAMRGHGADVRTMVAVGVDYALAPR